MRTLEAFSRFKPSRAQLIGGSLILSAGMLALAAVPNTFTSGTTISSTAVNANFTDADTRITTLETTVNGGNVVLENSTATTGNIMKGTDRFLHNFGLNNTFLGVNAGNFTMPPPVFQSAQGTGNTAIGANSLFSNTTGFFNTASGYQALTSNTTGYLNTASGYQALTSNTTGTENTAIGSDALRRNTDGYNNVAVGSNALGYLTTGGGNVAIGGNAGSEWRTTESGNIALGDPGVLGESNTIRIGHISRYNGDARSHTRTFIAGISGVGLVGVGVVVGAGGQLGIAASSRSVKDDIADMGEASSTLMKLRPVTFHYKSDQNPKGRSLQYGLIAEEVEKVAPGLVARNAMGEIETVYYQHLTPMLLNEYQKQQRLIETQTALLAKQTARVAALEKQGQEIVALKQEVARMAAVLARLGQPEKVASAAR